jgi:hypothetical protein
MGTRQLISVLEARDPVETAERYNRLLARYPEAPQYTEEEIADFAFSALAIEHGRYRDDLGDLVRAAGIRIPRHVSSDLYQTGRFVLRRWRDPAMRRIIMYIRAVNRKVPYFRSALQGDVQPLADDYEHFGPWPLVQVAVLHDLGRADLVPAFNAALNAERRAYFQANLAYGRYLMLKYCHGLPGHEKQPTASEQRQIIQRIHKRELQLQTMRRNLYTLSQERKSLTARLRETDHASRAELTRLLAELVRLQQALAEAEREHAVALAARTEAYQNRLATLEAALAPIQQDFTAALAERNRWAPATMLAGLTVAIIGDDGRADGYRTLVESAGGRLIHVSALEKFSRIPEAIATADVVIVMTAIAKHQAEHRLRKAARPGAIVLRCAKAGLGALERLLQVDLLPRLSLAQVAQARAKGGEADA